MHVKLRRSLDIAHLDGDMIDAGGLEAVILRRGGFPGYGDHGQPLNQFAASQRATLVTPQQFGNDLFHRNLLVFELRVSMPYFEIVRQETILIAHEGGRELMMRSKVALQVMSLMLVLPAMILAGNVNSHSPIVIQSDSDFTGCQCVTGGTGSTSDPFVIGPWSINKAGTGAGIYVDGTNLTKSFVILNAVIAGNGSNSVTGIVLTHINPNGTPSIVAEISGSQTSIQAVGVGITVNSSSYVYLDGDGSNPAGAGIVNNGAGTINHNLSGAIDVENSSHIAVKGWQFSSNGQDHKPDWIGLNPSVDNWGVGGVRFFNVTNSSIDHNAANNCTSISFSLFSSSHNSVSNNTADYPFTMNFIVADGSSYNTLENNVASTGDFIGYMIADPLPGTSTYGASHHNTLMGNISHSDGPTGNEIKGNIVPAFLGGFVVLNGTFDNTIQNNQDWASSGTGFVWAQAVPSSTTPIGIVTYPPILHCNVSVSDGPVSVAGLNGNVWKGNTSQAIDPCIPPQ